MPESFSPHPIQALLAHREWVHRVARALVSDEARADDLEQETWLKAMTRPPRHGRSPKAWLGTVLRRTASDLRRSDRRRSLREVATARAEGTRSTSELVAEAEALKRVVTEVLALEEPYRATLLLRYVDDLGPAGIAERMGVSIETVRTRLKRGLARLRSRFAAGSGGGRSWSAALLPLARRASVEPVAVGGGVPLVAGGLVALLMTTTKSKLLIGIAVLLVGTGGALWFAAGREPERASREATSPSTSEVEVPPPPGLTGRAAPDAAVDESPRPLDEAGSGAPAPTRPSEASAETAGFVVEVVDERGIRVGEGTVHVSPGGLRMVNIDWIEQPERYGWLFENHDLAQANPVEVEGIAKEFSGWELEAIAVVPPYPPSEPVSFRIEAGKVATLRLEVRAGGRVDVDVHDIADERPVAGARVASLTELSRRRVQPGSVDAPHGPGWATTSEDGRATVEELGAGPHDIEVLAEGFRPGRLDDVRLDGSTVVVRLERSRDQGVFEILVLDPEGNPVSDFRVELNTRGRLTPLIVRTDARGIARFSGLAPGIQFAKVDVEEWGRRSRAARWPLNDERLTLSAAVDLPAGEARTAMLGYPRGSGSLLCEVVDVDGRPVAGIEVRLAGPSRRKGRSDSAGRVSFRELVSGSYRTILHRTEEWFDALAHEVGEGGALQVRRVLGDRSIAGVVRAATPGRPPVAWARVAATGTVFASTQTGADGSFLLEEVAPGRYGIEVAAEGFASAEVSIDVVRGAEARVPEILLPRGGRILLVVAERDRAGLDSTRLTLVDSEGEEVALRPDASGEHDRTTGRLRPGRYLLTLKREGGDRTERPVVVADGEDSIVSLENR